MCGDGLSGARDTSCNLHRIDEVLPEEAEPSAS